MVRSRVRRLEERLEVAEAASYVDGGRVKQVNEAENRKTAA